MPVCLCGLCLRCPCQCPLAKTSRIAPSRAAGDPQAYENQEKWLIASVCRICEVIFHQSLGSNTKDKSPSQTVCVLGEEGAGLPPTGSAVLCPMSALWPALSSWHLECLQGSLGRTTYTSLANSFCADVITLVFSTNLTLSAFNLLENPQICLMSGFPVSLGW